MNPLETALRDARARTLLLVSDLDGPRLLGPRLDIVNPPLWEMGHLAWFQEFWTLRTARGRPPLVPHSDALYDSARVAHDTRWDLPLLDRKSVFEYLETILERSIAALHSGGDTYFHELALFHEDMHDEAFAYTRQTLAYPDPFAQPDPPAAGAFAGDASIPGARYRLGAERGTSFVFDNEKWAHEVEVAPFRMARAPVTNSEFAAFVEAGGYRNERLWSPEGWRWRAACGAQKPVYWERTDGGWAHRRYDSLRPLPPDHPVIHVSWYEAEAFCSFAGRRLPTEAEWELAASTPEKRRFPWGDEEAPHANLDARAGGTVPVAAHPEGDSAYGLRQMIGNVWEWTATTFEPYPGFEIDPYKEYSQPWFGTHKVLRGGCWATRTRLLSNTYRNFYTPDRRDIFAGFRTCAR